MPTKITLASSSSHIRYHLPHTYPAFLRATSRVTRCMIRAHEGSGSGVVDVDVVPTTTTTTTNTTTATTHSAIRVGSIAVPEPPLIQVQDINEEESVYLHLSTSTPRSTGPDTNADLDLDSNSNSYIYAFSTRSRHVVPATDLEDVRWDGVFGGIWGSAACAVEGRARVGAFGTFCLLFRGYVDRVDHVGDGCGGYDCENGVVLGEDGFWEALGVGAIVVWRLEEEEEVATLIGDEVGGIKESEMEKHACEEMPKTYGEPDTDDKKLVQ